MRRTQRVPGRRRCPVRPRRSSVWRSWWRGFPTHCAAQPERQETVRALAAVGPELIAALERVSLDQQRALPEAVYRDVLALRSRAFAALEAMRSQDLAERRRAAEELERLAPQQTLGRLAAARLGAIIAHESDALICAAP